MKNICGLFFWGFALLLLSSCGSSPDQQASANLFDLKGFFQREIAVLKHNGTTLEKQLVNGDQTDATQSDSVDWNRELVLFLDADLSSPSQRGNYRADTLELPRGFRQVSISRLKEGNGIQRAEITINPDNDFELVNVVLLHDNWISFERTELGYQPGRGYSIKSTRKNLFSEEHQSEVLGTFGLR